MQGKGRFSTTVPGFADYLSQLGGDRSVANCFTARNFLLDEGVLPGRVVSYEAAGAATAHGSLQEWQGRHEDYLKDFVFRSLPADGPPPRLDPANLDTCPETFRNVEAQPQYLGCAETLDLVRVESLAFIARVASISPAQLKVLVSQVVSDLSQFGESASTSSVTDLDAILQAWSRLIDLRPVFAGFWEDLQNVFGAGPSADPAFWADTLRDRLGLAHHDPVAKGGPIDILVFRYPVKLIPPLRGGSVAGRPLVPPTVLDTRFSEPFLPAPFGSRTGHTVELASNTHLPRREVLHPNVVFLARHVFRVGTIQKPLPGDLPDARGLHILDLQERTGRPDYAADTDRDLV